MAGIERNGSAPLKRDAKMNETFRSRFTVHFCSRMNSGSPGFIYSQQNRMVRPDRYPRFFLFCDAIRE